MSPTDASASRSVGESALLPAIGTWALAASIVNITIGGGIFRIPGSPEVGVLGPAAPVVYVACALVMGLIVLCIAQAGSRISVTGGPYAYVESSFGRYAGFLVGVLLWLIGATAIPGVAGLFADAMGKLVPALNDQVGRAAVLAVIFAVVSFVNVRGVKYGTSLNVVFTVAKLLPLFLLLVVGMLAVKPANMAWTNGFPAMHDVARASMVLIFIFCGVESALVPSGEVRDTRTTVPRALFIALGAVTVVYMGLQVVAQGVLGTTLVGDSTPLASAATRVFGTWGGVMIATGLMISAFGFLGGMMLATPRALFAFARDGILPRQFTFVHPKYRTPWIAIVAQAGLAWVLAITNRFETLAIIANMSALLIYLGCAAAAFKILRTSARSDGFEIPGGIVIPVLAALAIVFLLSAVTVKEWTVLAVTLAVGTVLYLLATRRHD
jgi:APA family basic amino acid/polyamine antiporter